MNILAVAVTHRNWSDEAERIENLGKVRDDLPFGEDRCWKWHLEIEPEHVRFGVLNKSKC